jgi:hypothetical protein
VIANCEDDATVERDVVEALIDVAKLEGLCDLAGVIVVQVDEAYSNCGIRVQSCDGKIGLGA